MIESANAQLTRMTKLFHLALERDPAARLLFLHPEDKGAADRGRPASPWQLNELRELARQLHLFRIATFQCEFGEWATPGPLGLLTSVPIKSSRMWRGWPSFKDETNDHYVGPLPAECNCRRPHQTWAQMSAEACRATSKKNHFNPQFLDWMAHHFTDEILKDTKPLPDGEDEGVRDQHSDSTWEEEEPEDFYGAIADQGKTVIDDSNQPCSKDTEMDFVDDPTGSNLEQKENKLADKAAAPLPREANPPQTNKTLT